MLLAQKLNICTTKFSIYDIGTHESTHKEKMVTFGYPNGEIITATQLSSFCYAGRYASSLKLRKTYHWNRTGSQWYALKKLCASSKKWLARYRAVGSALPWGNRGKRFKVLPFLVTKTTDSNM